MIFLHIKTDTELTLHNLCYVNFNMLLPLLRINLREKILINTNFLFFIVLKVDSYIHKISNKTNTQKIMFENCKKTEKYLQMKITF